MHVVFRDTQGLEELEVPTDPGQDPADLVVLSFSDSDLGAFAAGWHRAGGQLPALRLCNLAALRHPVSVDQYCDTTLAGARAVLVRLIGGESYWPYGVASLQDLARRRGIALALLPGDGRPDPALDRLSTLPVAQLRRLTQLCDQGGAVAAQMALTELARAAGLQAPEVIGQAELPSHGFYDPERGVIAAPLPGARPVLVSFYRSYLAAADMAPVDALIAALRAAGFAATGAFAPSLRQPGLGRWLAPHLPGLAAVVNLTAFSARDDAGATPFDGADCPVFQMAMATAPRALWQAEERGLSAADLAMHVVLPEVDGRIFLGAISFKAAQDRDPALQFARQIHAPDHAAITRAVGRIRAWHRLARAATEAGEAPLRRAVVLSTYPGKSHQLAHAVGLDALASAGAMLGIDHQGLGRQLESARLHWPLADYLAALEDLPAALRAQLFAAWGEPDPAGFGFAAIACGDALVALQPERGQADRRAQDYHDLTRVPCHGYVAFYLWLRRQADVIVHMGAHGTLEWLPGKSVALSEQCWPQALLGDLPMVYPFIVNDPGEAAQAKRRLSAVTLGHLPPPLRTSALPANLAHLERLLDEYSTADGLDPRRRDRLVLAIRDEARAAGVEADLGLPADAAPAEAIPRIDRFLCDLKDSRFGDGLHVYGTAPGEAEGLDRALTGRRVAPGPSGSPARGRLDVLPTGRNLYTVDPRAVPTRNAHAQGIRLAEELLRRHLQDHGDWPRGLVVDLWGSATMRTAAEDFAMALHLAGMAPRWDEATGRVTGVEILPLAELGRPRIDVTLRVSGLFRDVFPGLAQLFEMGAAMLARRAETPADNPYLTLAPRVFGPAPGRFGLAMADPCAELTAEARLAAGEAWLAASAHAIGADGVIRHRPQALQARLAAADAFVHAQDLPESDLLLAADYAGHEAGFAAAMARIGAPVPALYHLDATRPEAPRARSLTEEIARVLRARAANPAWADGMMRHGYRGAAEIAATLEHLAAFAQLAGVVPGHLFDLYHDATLGRPDLVDFMARENPAALAAMRNLFARLLDSGLWVSRRNSILAEVGA
ncbi:MULTISPECIES: cobaltochelatase subunit CobN [unclassified Paracoccus (in: a-proteobacteria)]|uniref:cobaltochelatase subunit CobN n=1 Tax=unclassified Paracoccus (in: a-proteobacteria) TaxID=2688777 RepID=UPI0021E159FA|nr:MULTISPECIES: cobaltochelatase subunit CobN [unclassified Paracoccus (in: a-proteobacteria)]UXU75983.1 cobaltochelatase subunit CobN [Paracoccus sp. SMMA_5]UXU81892.1 cobaltochelatase subunit CobN [Paracoccus sp. SMMA_5_TC]